MDLGCYTLSPINELNGYDMPIMTIKTPASVLNAESKTSLSISLVAAAVECEQISDDPKKHALCLVPCAWS